MKKLILALIVSLLFKGFANAIVVFDPATYTPADTSQHIVTIDGVKYLKVTLDGWNTLIQIKNYVISDLDSNAHIKFTYKFDKGASSYDYANFRLFLQLWTNDPSNVNGLLIIKAPISDTLKQISDTLTRMQGSLKTDTVFNQIQIAAQNNIDWFATIGSTIYISKIEVTGLVYEITGLSNTITSGENLVSIFPNPATSEINIQSAALIEKIEIYDLAGKLISLKLVHAFSDKLLTNIYTDGIYFMKIYTSEGISNKKLVIKK